MRFGQYLAAAVLLVSVSAVQAQDSLFAPAVNYGAGDGPLSVFSADFDGDDNYDIAVVGPNNDSVYFLKKTGNGPEASAGHPTTRKQVSILLRFYADDAVASAADSAEFFSAASAWQSDKIQQKNWREN